MRLDQRSRDQIAFLLTALGLKERVWSLLSIILYVTECTTTSCVLEEETVGSHPLKGCEFGNHPLKAVVGCGDGGAVLPADRAALCRSGAPFLGRGSEAGAESKVLAKAVVGWEQPHGDQMGARGLVVVRGFPPEKRDERAQRGF